MAAMPAALIDLQRRLRLRQRRARRGRMRARALSRCCSTAPRRARWRGSRSCWRMPRAALWRDSPTAPACARAAPRRQAPAFSTRSNAWLRASSDRDRDARRTAVPRRLVRVSSATRSRGDRAARAAARGATCRVERSRCGCRRSRRSTARATALRWSREDGRAPTRIDAVDRAISRRVAIAGAASTAAVGCEVARGGSRDAYVERVRARRNTSAPATSTRPTCRARGGCSSREASAPRSSIRACVARTPRRSRPRAQFGGDDAAVVLARAAAAHPGRQFDTRPIAGTHPRGATAAEEERADTASWSRIPKERAEHVMLIDLERNDLGRVCDAGTVRSTNTWRSRRTRTCTTSCRTSAAVCARTLAGRCAARGVPGRHDHRLPEGALHADHRGARRRGARRLHRLARLAQPRWLGRLQHPDPHASRCAADARRSAPARASSPTRMPERELEETRAKARGMLLRAGRADAHERPLGSWIDGEPASNALLADRSRPALRRRPVRDASRCARVAPRFLEAAPARGSQRVASGSAIALRSHGRRCRVAVVAIGPAAPWHAQDHRDARQRDRAAAMRRTAAERARVIALLGIPAPCQSALRRSTPSLLAQRLGRESGARRASSISTAWSRCWPRRELAATGRCRGHRAARARGPRHFGHHEQCVRRESTGAA